VIDDTDNPRLCELLQRHLSDGLSEAERAELGNLLDRSPDARVIVARLEDEERSMNQTIESAVKHFDFAKARHALEAKLNSDRASLRLQMVFGGLTVAIAAVLAAYTSKWGGVFLVAAAALLAVLARALIVARRRSLVASLDQPVWLEAAFERHLRNGRLEFTVLRAMVILGGLGMVVLFIDGVGRVDPLRIIIPLCVLVFVGPPTARLLFRRSAVARHERFLAGEISRSAWMTGKDESR